MRALLPENEFIELYRAHGPRHLTRLLNCDEGTIGQRRRAIERRLGVEIKGPRGKNSEGRPRIPVPKGAPQIDVEVKDGHVIVGSDCHYWPGDKTLMHKALVAACKEYKPKLVVLNGDVMDLPSISRHDPIGWEHWPKVHEEIEWAQDMTHEIAQAAGRAIKTWTFGNHEQRFESRLARMAPEYAKVHGVHLKDHFNYFEPCWQTVINPKGEAVIVKHRFRSGIHAPWNNVMNAGTHIVTGHLHSAKVYMLDDYYGTWFGVDTGCVAEPNARTFTNYTEMSPKNWRSAFGIFTFKEGRLMQPELVLKFDDKRVQFRGQVFTP